SAVLYWLGFVTFFFFFQAEDGIRDRNVTGVQTCALPISTVPGRRRADESQGVLQGTPASPDGEHEFGGDLVRWPGGADRENPGCRRNGRGDRCRYRRRRETDCAGAVQPGAAAGGDRSLS